MLKVIGEDRPTKIVMPTNGIDRETYNEIHRMMAKEGFATPTYCDPSLDSQEDVESEGYLYWVWLTNRGTLPKRLAKYCKARNGEIIPHDLLSRIGNVVAACSTKNVEVYIDYTHCLDWQRGDFGDDCSCFWTVRDAARYLITQNGGFALREFKKKEPKDGCSCGECERIRKSEEFSGFARVWCIPKDLGGARCYAIWNSYSEDSSRTLQWWARILATTQGMSYKKVDLSNSPDAEYELPEDLIWINSGGFLIGDDSVISKVSHVDLEIKGHSKLPKCKRCKSLLHPDTDGVAFGSVVEYDGLRYCRNNHKICDPVEFVPCELCNEETPEDELRRATVDRRTISVCRFCVNNLFYCVECEGYTANGYVEVLGYRLCRRCASKYGRCHGCGALTKTKVNTRYGKEFTCSYCIRNMEICPLCATVIDSDDYAIWYRAGGKVRLAHQSCIESRMELTSCEVCGVYSFGMYDFMLTCVHHQTFEDELAVGNIAR